MVAENAARWPIVGSSARRTGVAPVLDRSRSAKLDHLCCREPWIGWMYSPLVKPVLANSETDLTEIFQAFECRAHIRRVQVRPGEQR